MSKDKKNNDQKAKETIMNLCNASGLNTWFISKIVGSPGILYGAFYADGVNIYKFDKVQPVLVQSYAWKDFTNASVDFFSMKTVIVFNGEQKSSTIVVLEKGKDLIPLLQSQTNITIDILNRPFWRKILGFRSKKKWKMAVAVIAYLMLFGAIIDAFNDQSSTPSSTTSSPGKTPEQIAQEKAAADKITDADKALLIKNQYKLFTEDEIKQFSEIEKKYSALPDAEKAEVKADFERLSEQKKYQKWIKDQFSAWDGSNKPLVDMLKKHLNDPDSFEHEETRYSDKGDHLLIKMTYRAKNGFGGLVLQNVTAKSDYKTQTISIISQND